MINALKKIGNFGGKVKYNAPLLMPADVMGQYKTVPIGEIFSEYFQGFMRPSQ